MALFVAKKRILRCEPKKWHALRPGSTSDFILVCIQPISSVAAKAVDDEATLAGTRAASELFSSFVCLTFSIMWMITLDARWQRPAGTSPLRLQMDLRTLCIWSGGHQEGGFQDDRIITRDNGDIFSLGPFKSIKYFVHILTSGRLLILVPLFL